MSTPQHDQSNQDAPDRHREAQDQRLLVHVSYPLWRRHTLIALARAKELQDAGHEVLVTHCDSTSGTCAVNYQGNPVSCAVCQRRVRATAAKLELQVIPLRVDQVPESATRAIPLAQKKGLVEGVRSALTSTFRTLPGRSRSSSILSGIRKRYYATTSKMLVAMGNVIEEERIERVEVFNGRHACSKFALIAARARDLPFTTLESTARGTPIIHENCVVHDRKRIQERIRKQPLDMELAEQFYSGRRTPRDNRFAKKHSAQFQPPQADNFRRKVSIFLSSQDEFESLGKEWASPFHDYADVVEKICHAHPDTLFCIRFHPNQATIVDDIETPFHKIEQLPNVVVYYPRDTVNSYGLMEWSDTVVTFGSTVTIEANWSGKPVIMLGPSYFDELDVSYNPKTTDEAIALLREPLAPKSRENAARFAHYIEKEHDPMKYVEKRRGRMEGKGFNVAHLPAGQVVRSIDDVFCHIVRWFESRRKPEEDASDKAA